MRTESNDLKILLLDIETSPCLAYVWSLWKEVGSTNMVERDWIVLCWSAKWLGSKEVMSDHAIKLDDSACIKSLHRLLDEADIVIAHNGDNFDIKKINTRFLLNGLNPPSQFRTIDTLKQARKHFKFTSNRLDDLGQYLGVGRKKKTGGFQLWRDCIQGVKGAIEKMVRYCCGDVTLLEKVYLKMRPFIATHPNVGALKEGVACTKCGSSRVHARGWAVTNKGRKKRYQCQSCGGWFQ
jgi:DNA polymerase elongation subunit (family B)